MAEQDTELARMQILRFSNEESNRITREAIESALIILMREKAFSAISITDIVKKAGVSRTAYYRNYASEEDILQNVVTDLVNKITSAMSRHDPNTEAYDFWLEMFRAAENDADTFSILFSANLGETIFHKVNQMLIENKHLEGADEQYAQLFWNGAAFGVVAHWITHHMPQTPEEMTRIICNTISPLQNQK